VFKAFPDLVRPLIVYHERLMRGPSALSVADRERIAAYASGGHHAGSACLDLPLVAEEWDSRSPFLDQLHAALRGTCPVSPAPYQAPGSDNPQHGLKQPMPHPGKAAWFGDEPRSRNQQRE